MRKTEIESKTSRSLLKIKSRNNDETTIERGIIMIYKMKVTITDPHTEENMFSSLNFNLDCKFTYNPEQYGNGYYVTITSNKFFCHGTDLRIYGQGFDLRYDKSFDRNNKAKWLEEWAKNYWNGKNGAWAIKTLEIIKVE